MQQQLQEVFSRYDGERSDLIPILQDAQGVLGYIPGPAMTAIARFLRVPESTVYGVVTFYAQFHLAPQGKHKVEVCEGTACHVRGARRIMRAVQRQLGIGPGETTEDLQFTLERVACLGSCALAPAIVVDGQMHGNVTTAKVDKLFAGLRAESSSEDSRQPVATEGGGVSTS